MNSIRQLFVMAVAAAMLGACGILGPTPLTVPALDNSLPDTPRNLPTHADSGISMLALLEGRLELVGPCLLVVGGGVGHLPVWPSNYWLDGEILRSGRARVAALGETVELSGGYVPVQGRLFTNPIHPACARGEVFWVGS
jgi:hypothetical protein